MDKVSARFSWVLSCRGRPLRPSVTVPCRNSENQTLHLLLPKSCSFCEVNTPLLSVSHSSSWPLLKVHATLSEDSVEGGLGLGLASDIGAREVGFPGSPKPICIVYNPFYKCDSEQPPNPLPQLLALSGEAGWFVGGGKTTWITVPCTPLSYVWSGSSGSPSL